MKRARKKVTQKMQPDLKKRWVKALRSGRYQQAHGRLMEGHREGFCCLGVLCNVVKPRGWDASGSWCFNRKDTVHNDAVAGSLTASLREQFGLNAAQEAHLIKMNDGTGGVKERSFKEIAAWIEENL